MNNLRAFRPHIRREVTIDGEIIGTGFGFFSASMPVHYTLRHGQSVAAALTEIREAARGFDCIRLFCGNVTVAVAIRGRAAVRRSTPVEHEFEYTYA